MNGQLPPRAASVPALAAVVLGALTALLAVLRVRLSLAEREQAWPWPGAEPPLTAALALLGAATLLAIALAWLRHGDRAWRRSLGVCLVWPAVPLAAAWLVVPASGPPNVVTALAALAFGLVAAKLYRHAPRIAARPGPLRGAWIALHLAGAAILAALGAWGGGFDDPRAFVLSLALYPVYALGQLFLVLAVPWPHLRRLAGGGTAGPVGTVALLFALVHWPNPLLMLLTGGGMIFWSSAYARGRRLVVLALSMGLLASLAAQGLPDRWTDHMRVGPRFVRTRAVPRLASAAERRTRDLPAGEARTTAFLAELYPGITGREATSDELARWWRSIAACRRGVLAWRFYIGDEYRRKFGEAAGEAPLPEDVHWTRLPPPWPERIGAFTRDAPGQETPSWEDFLARLYREILQREASPAELAGWPRDLSPRQKRRLVRVLLELRRELTQAPFDTCTCRELRLHH